MIDPALQKYDLTRNVHNMTLYNTIAADQQHISSKPRLYLHLDLNCYYAQVEQLSYNLYGIPLIVGGWRKQDGTPRGIVATSSYEARKFGVKTGMSALEAQQLCPFIVFMQVHYEKYRCISKELKKILDNYAPDVEGYSMDEYFLDLTFLKHKSSEDLRKYGEQVKNEIYNKTGLVCSVGISFSKTYAKLASDIRKPNGLTIVRTADDMAEYIYPLELSEVWGIGRRRFEKLSGAGIVTIGDAFKYGRGSFQKLFGNYFGKMLYETTTGRDRARVLVEEKEHIPNEITYMHTFSDWTKDPDRVEGEIVKAVRQMCYRMRGYDRKARMFSIYIRFQDSTWQGINARFTTPGYTNLDEYVLEACLRESMPLVHRYLAQGYAIRGVGLHTIEMTDSRQLELFFTESGQLRHLHHAVDAINNHFGIHTVQRAGGTLHVDGKTHFLDRNGKLM